MNLKLCGLLAICCISLASAKVYTIDQDGMKFNIDLYSKGAKFEFKVPYDTVDKSMVIHLKTQKGDCPGYAYWFSKDNLNLPALSLSSACEEGEPTVKIRYEIGTDFAKRDTDSVTDGFWNFKGQLWYDQPIDKFKINDYTHLRVIRRANKGIIEATYNL